MIQNRPILYLQQPCEDAVPMFVERLQRSGLTVMRTFDLRDTRVGESACTCHNHGTEKCDCQMIVLLVYGKDTQPVSLIAHGHDGRTWFSLAEFFETSNTRLIAQICSVFAPHDPD